MHDCFASIVCKTRIVKFNFLNEPVLKWKGETSIPRGHIISRLKACKMISKGCLYHIVRVKDLDFENRHIELVPVIREFFEVFLNNLLGIPPEQEIDFSIDLVRIPIPF